MKKKALRKDFWMEIKKSPGRFISILFIVLLGVAFFSGIRASEPSMRISGDSYYDKSELMDIKAFSTFGVTEDDVEAFIRKAERMLDQQMDDNLDDLRDLALAVAEKVVCVSLKSSSEVIGRMIQTAVDKRKRREWVHIYIAECDAKRLTTLPAALTAALAELSDRVRIIPMADDEAGTCIIESPNEIIDASAATQMQNIRDMLNNHPGNGVVGSFNFSDK